MSAVQGEVSEGLISAEVSSVADYPLSPLCKIFKFLPLKLNVTVNCLPHGLECNF